MKKEWEDSQQQNGASPVQYLDKVGVSGGRMSWLHIAFFVDETDRKILAEAAGGDACTTRRAT